jgi:hypothetical protein
MFAVARAYVRPFCATLLLLTGCSGSGSDQPPSKTVAESPSEPDERLVHDVGKMVAGPVIKHTFEFVNNSGEKLTIEKPEDIAINCGCSGIEPEKRALEPGEKTGVSVTLQTVSKSGPMSYGGIITWTAAGGKTQKTQMLIVGTAIPPIAAEPQSLNFEPAEIRNKVAKPVRIRGNVPLDWVKVPVGSSSPYFKVSITRIESDAIFCDVVCDPPSDVESVQGDLLVGARLKPNADDLAESGVALRIPVRGRQTVELAISPKTPIFRFAETENLATSRLLLQGELVGVGPSLVKDITCKGYDVNWRLSDSKGSNSAILDVTIKRVAATAGPGMEKTLSITTTNRTITVQFVIVSATHNAKGD